jgi:hypothetical protein
MGSEPKPQARFGLFEKALREKGLQSGKQLVASDWFRPDLLLRLALGYYGRA